jgi:hypothetical protein
MRKSNFTEGQIVAIHEKTKQDEIYGESPSDKIAVDDLPP